MKPETATLAAIAGMALATYATRVSGLWLVRSVPVSPRLEAGMRHLPAAVLTALIAPTVLAGGPAAILALAATLLVAVRTGNTLLAMITGVGFAWLLRAALP